MRTSQELGDCESTLAYRTFESEQGKVRALRLARNHHADFPKVLLHGLGVTSNVGSSRAARGFPVPKGSIARRHFVVVLGVRPDTRRCR
jgi:hypothetical protein